MMKKYHTYLHESSTKEKIFQVGDIVRLSDYLLNKEDKDKDDIYAIRGSGNLECGTIVKIYDHKFYPMLVDWGGKVTAHKIIELDFYDNKKRKRIRKPDIDLFDEEDWGFEEINESIEIDEDENRCFRIHNEEEFNYLIKELKRQGCRWTSNPNFTYFRGVEVIYVNDKIMSQSNMRMYNVFKDGHNYPELETIDGENISKRIKKRRPDIDPYDEEDWGYEDINESITGTEIYLMDVWNYFNSDEKKVLAYLNKVLSGKLVKFSTDINGKANSIEKIITKVELPASFTFICNDGIYKNVHLDVPLFILSGGGKQYSRIRRPDIDPFDEEDWGFEEINESIILDDNHFYVFKADNENDYYYLMSELRKNNCRWSSGLSPEELKYSDGYPIIYVDDRVILQGSLYGYNKYLSGYSQWPRDKKVPQITDIKSFKNRKKITRPDIDPFDEEDWGYEEINEGVWNLPAKKPNRYEFTISDKIVEFKYDYNKLSNFLKEEVTDNMVEFGENSIIRKLIKGVKIQYVGEEKQILFIDNKNKRYVVDKYYPVTIYRNGKDNWQHIEKITGDIISDTNDKMDDDVNYLWLIGVPSGEAIRVSRKMALNDLFNKRIIFFVKDYSPTFYGFKDEDRNKVRDTYMDFLMIELGKETDKTVNESLLSNDELQVFKVDNQDEFDFLMKELEKENCYWASGSYPTSRKSPNIQLIIYVDNKTIYNTDLDDYKNFFNGWRDWISFSGNNAGTGKKLKVPPISPLPGFKKRTKKRRPDIDPFDEEDWGYINESLVTDNELYAFKVNNEEEYNKLMILLDEDGCRWTHGRERPHDVEYVFRLDIIYVDNKTMWRSSTASYNDYLSGKVTWNQGYGNKEMPQLSTIDDVVKYKKRTKIRRPDIDPFDEEDWGYVQESSKINFKFGDIVKHKYGDKIGKIDDIFHHKYILINWSDGTSGVYMKDVLKLVEPDKRTKIRRPDIDPFDEEDWGYEE